MVCKIVPSREDLFKRALALYGSVENAVEAARMQLAGAMQNPGQLIDEQAFVDEYINAVEYVRTAVAYDMSQVQSLFREIRAVLAAAPKAAL